MKNSTITAILYSFNIPITVLIGFMLGTEKYILSLIFIVFLMFMEYFSVKFWIKAQTEEINRNLY